MAEGKRKHENCQLEEAPAKKLKKDQAAVARPEGDDPRMRLVQILDREIETEITSLRADLETIEDRIFQTKQYLMKVRQGVVSECYHQSNKTILQRPLHPAVKKILRGKAPRSDEEYGTTGANYTCYERKITDSPLSDNSKEHSGVTSDGNSSDTRGVQSSGGERSPCMDVPPTAGPPPPQSGNDPGDGGNGSQNAKIPRYIPPKVLDKSVSKLCQLRENTRKQKIRFVVGNVSKWVTEQCQNITHKWTVYIKSLDPDVDLASVVSKAKFFLHPSYKPNDVIQVTRPPFKLTRRGWGEFPLRVQLHFVNNLNKPMDIVHQLKLDQSRMGMETFGCETVADVWLNVEGIAKDTEVNPDWESIGKEEAKYKPDENVPSCGTMLDHVAPVAEEACDTACDIFKGFPLVKTEVCDIVGTDDFTVGSDDESVKKPYDQNECIPESGNCEDIPLLSSLEEPASGFSMSSEVKLNNTTPDTYRNTSERPDFNFLSDLLDGIGSEGAGVETMEYPEDALDSYFSFSPSEARKVAQLSDDLLRFFEGEPLSNKEQHPKTTEISAGVSDSPRTIVADCGGGVHSNNISVSSLYSAEGEEVIETEVVSEVADDGFEAFDSVSNGPADDDRPQMKTSAPASSSNAIFPIVEEGKIFSKASAGIPNDCENSLVELLEDNKDSGGTPQPVMIGQPSASVVSDLGSNKVIETEVISNSGVSDVVSFRGGESAGLQSAGSIEISVESRGLGVRTLQIPVVRNTVVPNRDTPLVSHPVQIKSAPVVKSMTLPSSNTVFAPRQMGTATPKKLFLKLQNGQMKEINATRVVVVPGKTASSVKIAPKVVRLAGLVESETPPGTRPTGFVLSSNPGRVEPRRNPPTVQGPAVQKTPLLVVRPEVVSPKNQNLRPNIVQATNLVRVITPKPLPGRLQSGAMNPNETRFLKKNITEIEVKVENDLAKMSLRAEQFANKPVRAPVPKTVILPPPTENKTIVVQRKIVPGSVSLLKKSVLKSAKVDCGGGAGSFPPRVVVKSDCNDVRNCPSQDVESAVSWLVKRHPVVDPRADVQTFKSLHPYCAINRQTFLEWPLPKQRAAEWLRAKTVMRMLIDVCPNLRPWTTVEILKWARVRGFTPVKLEVDASSPVFTPDVSFKLTPCPDISGMLAEFERREKDAFIDVVTVDDKKDFAEPCKTLKDVLSSGGSFIPIEERLRGLASFVEDHCRRICCRLTGEEIVPDVFYPVSLRIMVSVFSSLAEDLMRRSHEAAWHRFGERAPSVVEEVDVRSALLSRPEFDLFTRAGQGNPPKSVVPSSVTNPVDSRTAPPDPKARR